MFILDLIEKHVWSILGAFVGSVAGYTAFDCRFGAIYGILLMAGTPTLLIFPLDPRTTCQYHLWLGAGFSITALLTGSAWMGFGCGLISGIVTFSVHHLIHFIDNVILGYRLPARASVLDIDPNAPPLQKTIPKNIPAQQ